MTFQPAVKLGEFPESGVAHASLGGKDLAIIRIGGAYYALDGLCTHAEGELYLGTLTDDQLVCPAHEGRFDPRTGKANPADDWVTDIKSYPAREEGGWVMVDL